METRNIVRLPRLLSDQIAAGEVIDGPASVVKELVENALDAGATEINIRLRDGGKTEIQVTDNGAGMPKDELALSVERFATSKIRTFQDLLRLQTHGFRGEALASMAAVAKLVICSRSSEQNHAWSLDVDPIQGRTVHPAAHDRGTSVSVHHLFSWVPARKKHLKSARVEGGRCMRLLWPLLVLHPEIRFELDRDPNTPSVVFSACQDVKDRFFQVFPMHKPHEVFPVGIDQSAFEVKGFLSNPMATLGDRRHLFTAVNHRVVMLPSVLSVLRRTFSSVDGKRGYPWGVLRFSIPSATVDFNVDPKKETVRIVEEESVIRGFQGYLNRLVSHGRLIAPSVHRGISDPRSFVSERSWSVAPQRGTSFSNDSRANIDDRPMIRDDVTEAMQPLLRDQSEGGGDGGQAHFGTENHLQQDGVGDHEIESDRHPDCVNWSELKLIGVMNGLIICAHDEAHFFFLDQHAIHERILYEQYMASYRERNIPVQFLLVPEKTEVDEETWARFGDILGDLRELGFHLNCSESVPRCVTLEASPTFFGESIGIQTLVHWVHETGKDIKRILQQEVGGFVATLACRRSVKRGDCLQAAEVHAMFESAKRWIGNKVSCQHGRPFVTKISLEGLYRSFFRKR